MKAECKMAWEQEQQRATSSHATVNQSTYVKNDDSLTAWSDDDEIDIDGQLEEEDVNEEGDHNQLVLLCDLGPPSPIIDSKDVGQLGFTVAQFCETKLLKLLNDKQVPHSLYKDVLEWSCNAKRLKYSFEPTCTKCSTMITHLTKWQVKQNCCPLQNKTILPGEPELSMMVTCYDFKSELMSLLASPVFEDIENLDTNVKDPFSKYQSPSGQLNCFNAGKLYSDSYHWICQGPNDFFLPIIFS